MRNKITLLLILAQLAWPAALPAVAGAAPKKSFMVSPAKLEIKAKPGAAQTKSVKVANQGSVPVNITTSIADYSIRPNNTFVFYQPGHQTYSSSKWVTVDQPAFTLAPGEAKMVKITMAVPSQVEVGGHYASVFFQTAGPKVAKTGVRIVARIGVLLLSTIGNARDIVRDGYIKDFTTANPWWSRDAKPRLVFHNNGNVHLTLKGHVAFTDIFGRQVGRADFQDITLLPNSDRIMTTKWNGPWFGRLTAKATTTYGPDLFTFDHTEKSQVVAFWIIPWQLILALLGTAVAAILVKKLVRRHTYVSKHSPLGRHIVNA